MMNEEKKPKNGITEAVSLDNQEFRVRMDRIVKALKDAGYDPYMQLYGYLETGDDSYITRKDNARDEIGELNREMVREFTMTLKKSE
jgi:uncharacterized protein (UPF0297 family)